MEDLMLIGSKIPFVNENISMKAAWKNIEKKGLGVLVVKDKHDKTNGILTDGDLKRLSNSRLNYQNLKIKKVMKKPISVDKNMLANKHFLLWIPKITSLRVSKQ